jgi:hypothetical protein
MDRRSSFVAAAALLTLATAMSTAGAQGKPDLRAFSAAVPELRTRIAAQDWEGFVAAARPFAALRPDLYRRDEADDLLNALHELGVWKRTPEDAMTQGLLADTYGETAIADACYKQHLANGPARSWSVKSTFVSYRARLAVQRGDLGLAQSLLVEQRERLEREQGTTDPAGGAAVDAHLRAVRELATAPADPWRRFAFARAYWRTTWPPILSPQHAVRRELERLLGEPAVRQDRTLLLAIRCEQIAESGASEDAIHPRALTACVACVDGQLLAAAAQRRDVADPWSPLLTIGRLLQRARDPARALAAFDALVAGAAALPQQSYLVQQALIGGAECAIERGDGAGALTRLDRAARDFARTFDCGFGEAQRVESLRKRAQALPPR